MIDQMKMILIVVEINQAEVALNLEIHAIEMVLVTLKVDHAQLQETVRHQDHRLIEDQGQVMRIETRADTDRVQVEEVINNKLLLITVNSIHQVFKISLIF